MLAAARRLSGEGSLRTVANARPAVPLAASPVLCRTYCIVSKMLPDFQPRVNWDPQVWGYLSTAFGEQHWRKIAAKLATPPLSLCFRVNTLKIGIDEGLVELRRQICERDGKGEGEVEIERVAGLPNVVVLKGYGPLAVDAARTEDSSGGEVKRVVVDRKCGEAVLRGAPIYVPGVLGCSPNVQAGDEVAVSVALKPMTRGTVLGSAHDGSVQDSALFIGIGRCEFGRSELFRKKNGVAVQLSQPIFRIPSGSGLLEGKGMLQNLPSAVAAAVLAPTPGSRILDMCAAPGGKTTALAELIGDKGEIIALDRTHDKAGNIHDLAAELGLACISAYKMDARKALLVPSEDDESLTKAQKNQQLSVKGLARQQRREAAMRARGIEPTKPRVFEPPCRGWPPEAFDFILLDAPCTGLGLRPRLSQDQSLADLEGAAAYQRKLIDTAVELLRCGGQMVYSTCSINPSENEGNVRYLLDKFPAMQLVQAAPRLGGPGLIATEQQAWLSESERHLVQRFDPADPLDTIGFFIAKFHKSIGGDEVSVMN